jgi:hypothetical protein
VREATGLMQKGEEKVDTFIFVYYRFFFFFEKGQKRKIKIHMSEINTKQKSLANTGPTYWLLEFM